MLADGRGPVPHITPCIPLHIPPHRAGVWGLIAMRSPLPGCPRRLWGESTALPHWPCPGDPACHSSCPWASHVEISAPVQPRPPRGASRTSGPLPGAALISHEGMGLEEASPRGWPLGHHLGEGLWRRPGAEGQIHPRPTGHDSSRWCFLLGLELWRARVQAGQGRHGPGRAKGRQRALEDYGTSLARLVPTPPSCSWGATASVCGLGAGASD